VHNTSYVTLEELKASAHYKGVSRSTKTRLRQNLRKRQKTLGLTVEDDRHRVRNGSYATLEELKESNHYKRVSKSQKHELVQKFHGKSRSKNRKKAKGRATIVTHHDDVITSVPVQQTSNENNNNTDYIVEEPSTESAILIDNIERNV